MVNESQLRASIAAALGPQVAVLGSGAVGGAAGRILRILGPFPAGSPPAMRAAASRLHAIADDARRQGDRTVAAVGRCGSWQGGAQRRMHAAVQHERAHIHRDADALDQAAQRLAREAGLLERRQADWNARIPRLRDDAVSGLLAAARRVT